jgi:hypothetical protein
MGAYAPSTKKKIYFEVSKFFNKKLYMYISIIYVYSLSFTGKPIFFVIYVKEDKIYLLES